MTKLLRTTSASAAAMTLLSASSAWAAGTAVDVQSARGIGMAGATTAFVDDSSAVFYNPAGIAQGRILDVQAGDTLIVPGFKYTQPGGSSTTNSFNVVPPFHAYASGGITRDLSVGVGVFTPYGLTLAWPSGWVGSSLITKSVLATYEVNPTVAYRFGPLRLGAGFQIVRATVQLNRDIQTGTDTASTEVGGSAWGYGANVGAQVEAIPRYLSFGAHYRSATKLDFNGHAHFDNVPVELQGTLVDQAVSTSLTNPDSFAMAVASRPIPQLVVDFEAVWFGWSKYRSIDVNFPNDTTGTLSSTEPKNWGNTVNWRIGAELALNDSWRIRAGVLYDPSPSSANTLLPDLPDANRLNLAAGVGYAHPSGLHLDVGYQFLYLFQRTSTAPQLPGDYGGTVNILGVTIGYRTPTPTPPLQSAAR